MKILALETSCDETAAAIVENGTRELAAVLATSKAFHEETGGVVPEVAARKQLDYILPVLAQLEKKYGEPLDTVDAIAATIGPGLLGSLLIGVETAKALALALNKPFIPVNHLVGHIYANFITPKKAIVFPAIVLIVSGGHTGLVLMRDHMKLEYLGGTLDDAAGEAFDKIARLLGISQYLGGIELSRTASQYTETKTKHPLPRPKLHDNDYDFSFSGLKSAVKRIVDTYDLENKQIPVAEVAYEFENAVVDVLVTKTFKAAKNFNCKTILLGGGVAANSRLRERLTEQAVKESIELHVPPLTLCGDNAVYIASAAYFNQHLIHPTKLGTILPNPGLSITD